MKPYYQDNKSGITIYHADCLEVMRTLPENSAHAVITDPPFEAEAHINQKRLGKDGFNNNPLDFAKVTDEQRSWLPSWARKNCGGWMLVFCQAESLHIWRDEFDRSGCIYKRAMVWIKPDGMPQWSGDRPGMGYETIAAAWCSGGHSRWNGGGRTGVFAHNKRGTSTREHQTQKPDALMNDLIKLFTDPGTLVFDPFMGSGTTGVACLRLGRRFVGIEISEKYFDVACRRIEKEYRRGDFIDPARRMLSRQGVLDK